MNCKILHIDGFEILAFVDYKDESDLYVATVKVYALNSIQTIIYSGLNLKNAQGFIAHFNDKNARQYLDNARNWEK